MSRMMSQEYAMAPLKAAKLPMPSRSSARVSAAELYKREYVVVFLADHDTLPKRTESYIIPSLV